MTARITRLESLNLFRRVVFHSKTPYMESFVAMLWRLISEDTVCATTSCTLEGSCTELCIHQWRPQNKYSTYSTNRKKQNKSTICLCRNTVTGRYFTYTKARSNEMRKGWGTRRTRRLNAIESSIRHFSKRLSWQVWGPLSLCMCDQTRLLWWPLKKHSRCWTCAAAASLTPPPPSSCQRFGGALERKKEREISYVRVFVMS